jgi:hypothetical protein
MSAARPLVVQHLEHVGSAEQRDLRREQRGLGGGVAHPRALHEHGDKLAQGLDGEVGEQRAKQKHTGLRVGHAHGAAAEQVGECLGHRGSLSHEARGA